MNYDITQSLLDDISSYCDLDTIGVLERRIFI
jgi:hypothetical protein